MKQIAEHRGRLLTRISLLFAVVLCTILVVGAVNNTSAAEKIIEETADYSVKVIEESGTKCKVVFMPGKSMSLVDIHYKVNGGDQQNLRMATEGNNWTHTIEGVASGNNIEMFFTYIDTSNAGKDSGWVNHVMGTAGGNDNSGDNKDDNNEPEVVNGTKIEAENYTSMSGVNKEDSRISSLDTNDWMRYQTDVDKNGTYKIVVRGKASGSADGKIVFRNDDGRIAEVTVEKGSDNFKNYTSGEFTLSKGSMELTSIVVSGGITADYFVLEPVKVDEGGNGGNGGNAGEVEKPEVDQSIPDRDNRMVFQFNNKTNGRYADNEIYWCIIGYKPGTMELCYVEADGTLVPVDTSMNTITVGDRKCADIYNTLADNSHVYMPGIVSGRMYLSYGSPVYITINKNDLGVTGFAGPDLNNPSDPNANVLFEFLEFTIGTATFPMEYFGNTTRVDNYCFPVVTRLVGEDGITGGVHLDVYDRTVGETVSREEMFAKYRAQAPADWQGLITKDSNGNDLRIIAPCKGDFNEGKKFGNYFDAYIDAFWTKYSKETLEFECQGGHFKCNVVNGVLEFTEVRTGQTGKVYKPTTQDVLEGKGNFNRGSSIELVLEAQLCAAFNRGIALHPEKWYTPSEYYQNDGENGQYPYNYYSKFMHENSVDGFSYGFCYDDVHDQSTLLNFSNPDTLAIDLKW